MPMGRYIVLVVVWSMLVIAHVVFDRIRGLATGIPMIVYVVWGSLRMVRLMGHFLLTLGRLLGLELTMIVR